MLKFQVISYEAPFKYYVSRFLDFFWPTLYVLILSKNDHFLNPVQWLRNIWMVPCLNSFPRLKTKLSRFFTPKHIILKFSRFFNFKKNIILNFYIRTSSSRCLLSWIPFLACITEWKWHITREKTIRNLFKLVETCSDLLKMEENEELFW